MIENIDKILCVNCELCIDICPMDVFRRSNGKVYIAYPGDCCNCVRCANICPTEAIRINPHVPKLYDPRIRWELVKAVLNVK
jgi:NAD-dependent dihydropyrimidine dehydrogenase PreA subunit